VAFGLVVVEPFPQGDVLLWLTDMHGVHTGDIPRDRDAAGRSLFRHLAITA
jgi:hypothetical protein